MDVDSEYLSRRFLRGGSGVFLALFAEVVLNYAENATLPLFRHLRPVHSNMDPVSTTVVSAIALGATHAADKLGEKLVTDSYAALKHLLVTAYGKATDLIESVIGLEKKPDSEGRQATVAEELRTSGAVDDERLIAAAEAVLAAAEQASAVRTIGIDWSDVKAARVKVGKIKARAGAIGFRAARMEIAGDVEVQDIDVAGGSGK